MLNVWDWRDDTLIATLIPDFMNGYYLKALCWYFFLAKDFGNEGTSKRRQYELKYEIKYE
jgi:hypothetical protein